MSVFVPNDNPSASRRLSVVQALRKSDSRQLALSVLVSISSGAVAAFSISFPILLGVFAGFVVLLVALTILLARPALLSSYAALTTILVFVDQSPITLGGSALRLYQPLSLALLVASIVIKGEAYDAARVSWLRSSIVVWTAAIWISLFWTISSHDTAVLAVGQLYLVALYAALILLMRKGLVESYSILVALRRGALLTSVVAAVQFFLGLIGARWGLQKVAGLPWWRPEGLMAEPDWAGLVAATGFILTLSSKQHIRYRNLQLCIFGLIVVVTGVRAVWIALVVAAFVAMWLRGEQRTKKYLIGLTGAALTILGVVLVTHPTLLERVNPFSFLNESSADEGALNSRLGVLQLIQDRGADRLVTGHGAGSLGYESVLPENRNLYAGGGELNSGRGSANILATAFWDLGLVGVVIGSNFILAWLHEAWKVRDHYPELLLVSVVLVVDFQANNGLRIGFVWIVLALITYHWHTNGTKNTHVSRNSHLYAWPTDRS